MPFLPFSVSIEGIRWFLGFFLASCVLLPFSGWAALGTLTCGALVALFFRIPHRKAPSEAELILSPADGKVVSVEEVQEPAYVGQRCKRIAIFLSLFDVHMNYAPADGVIDWVDYRKGKFHLAFEPKASEANENQRIGIDSAQGKILVRQIAGAVARRIVLFKKLRDSVRRGELLGMIRFGSRVEIYLPEGFSILVHPGERVAGGLTAVAKSAAIPARIL